MMSQESFEMEPASKKMQIETTVAPLLPSSSSTETKTTKDSAATTATEKKKSNTKYILVTGGVISGIGKGIINSSTGLVLKSLGLRITAIKIDPYLNVDCGTISPYEHGEVFVLDDGAECDLDLGNYERHMGLHLKGDNNLTSGKVYKTIIEKERRGDYLGKTVQVIPHVTDTIMDWIERVSKVPVDGTNEEPEVCLIELGGTVGDIESMPFIEALRQFQFRVGPENFCSIHVSLVPMVGSEHEAKSKPTQHSVRDLRAAGITPDLIMCRCAKPLDDEVKRKISMFCQLPPQNVISSHDCSNLFSVPLGFYDNGVWKLIFDKLHIPHPEIKTDMMASWREMVARMDTLESTTPAPPTVTIALVGKYTGINDTYLSVIKALNHASLAVNKHLEILWIDSSDLETDAEAGKKDKAWATLKKADGVLVPGGFGTRGVEGMIVAAKYARENKVPYLGLCLGMQIAVIEFARSVLEWEGANSAEFDEKCLYPVVVFMPEINHDLMGGNMRLGSRTSVLRVPPESSIVSKLYGGAVEISERHRHRYEVNSMFVPHFEKKGLRFVAHDTTRGAPRMEIVELAESEHPFFVATQSHPEFKSLPLKPSPFFLGFLQASVQFKTKEQN